MIRLLLLSAGLTVFVCQVTAQTVPTGYQFTSLGSPCRAVDTRVSGGAIAAGTFQSFNPQGGACAQNALGPFPQGPIAYALNVTVVPHGGLGYLSIWPTGQSQPTVSTLNATDGRVKANAAIVGGGNGGEVSVYVTDRADVVIDVTGYFAPTQKFALYGSYFYQAQGSELYTSTTPCRLVNTRLTMPLQAGVTQYFPASSTCFNPPNGGYPISQSGPLDSYSLNITAVPSPDHGLGYLTMWSDGGNSSGPPDVPLASTLNDASGTVVANAALLGSSRGYPNSNGLYAYASEATDVVIDATGYFQNSQTVVNGLAFYPVSPCRVLDTRQAGGAFQGKLTVNFTTSPCQLPASALSYVVNATVVPVTSLGFLTLWPNDGSPQPLVSTLNAADGFVTSNMAIVGAADGTNSSYPQGTVNAYASNPTNLIFDVTGYFALLTDTSGLKVAFMGDDTIQTTVAAVQEQHPNWINAGGPAGETTDKMLARFQTDVLDKHPDVVVIEAGQYDMATKLGSSYSACDSGPDGQMCANIGAMFALAYQAGIRYFIEPLISCDALCQQIAGTNAGKVELGIDDYNRLLILGEGQGGPPTPVILISGDLVSGSITILDGFTGSGTNPALAHASVRKLRNVR